MWASNLSTEPPSKGTLHAMIKGAMAAQDEQIARYATSKLN